MIHEVLEMKTVHRHAYTYTETHTHTHIHRTHTQHTHTHQVSPYAADTDFTETL